MKRKYRITIVAVLCLTFFPGQVRGETRTVFLSTTDVNNQPYVLGEGNHLQPENPGITIEVLRLIEQRLDVKFEITREPWARVLYDVENNKVDGIFHASYTKDRAEFGVYPMAGGQVDITRCIFNRDYVLYKRKDAPLTWDGLSLLNLKRPVGVIRGYAIIDDMKKLDIPMEELSSPEQGMNLLLLNRIDAFAELQNSGDSLLYREREKYGDIVKMSPPLQTKPYFIMFSREFYQNHTLLAESIWDEIHQLVASGEYDQIYLKYADFIP